MKTAPETGEAAAPVAQSGCHGFGHRTRWNRREQAGRGETVWTAGTSLTRSYETERIAEDRDRLAHNPEVESSLVRGNGEGQRSRRSVNAATAS